MNRLRCDHNDCPSLASFLAKLEEGDTIATGARPMCAAHARETAERYSDDGVTITRTHGYGGRLLYPAAVVGPWAAVWRLDGAGGMSAEIHYEDSDRTTAIVPTRASVRFRHESDPRYAAAEAHRFAAMMFDTVADLAQEDPIAAAIDTFHAGPADRDVGSRVEVESDLALILVGAFFVDHDDTSNGIDLPFSYRERVAEEVDERREADAVGVSPESHAAERCATCGNTKATHDAIRCKGMLE